MYPNYHLNFDSLYIDHVYGVRHFVHPGETIDSTSYSIFCGGKGLNQSVALARAELMSGTQAKSASKENSSRNDS